MVSPIKTFRKHRKLMLAILTLMAMLSFVFLPAVLEILSLRRGPRDKVAVTTKKYGDLRDSQVNTLLWQRGRWLVFLQDLQRLVAEHNGKQFLDPPRNPLVLIVGQTEYPLGPESEESVVETWLLSRKAREMGITISNSAINRFLGDLTGGRVNDAELAAMLKTLRLSQSSLFEIVRNELSAIRLRQMLTMDLAGATPAERWDYFRRLNRRAKIELLPIDAQKIVARVPDPTEEEEKDVKALFEDFKDKRPDPNSPDPGFREPHRIALQYFKAELRGVEGTASRLGKPAAGSPWALDLALRGVIGVQARNDFLNLDEVTEAEIVAFYDANQKEFRRPALPEVKPLPEKPPAPGQKKAAEQKPAEKKPAEKKAAETAKPAAESEPAKPPGPKGELGKPEPGKTQPGQEPLSKTGSPKSELPKGQPEKPSPAEKPPAKTSSSKSALESPFRLVSFEQEKGKEPGVRSPEVGGAAKEPGLRSPESGGAAKQPGVGSPESGGAAKQPGVRSPEVGGGAKQPGVRSPETGGAAKESGGAAKAGQPAEKLQLPLSPRTEIQPLDQVRDRIRYILAGQKAHDKIAAAFNVLQDAMARFERDWMAYQSMEKSEKETASPPQPPNLDLTAEKLGLKPVRTRVISERDAGQWDIGKSLVDARTPFVQRAFGSLALYRAMTAHDPNGNEYLFWKVEDYPERVPDWEDEGVRDRVVRAWKLIQARAIALGEADRLAARARELRKPLKEVVGKGLDAEVLTPPPFSWLTGGDLFSRSQDERLRLGEILAPGGMPIPAIENPFMEKLFAIPPGGADGIWNHPETVVYLVRVVEYLPLETTLWEDFQVWPWGLYSQAATFDEEAALAAWKQDLFAEAGLQWQREPERRGGTAEGSQ